MKEILIWACIISLFLLSHTAKSDEEEAQNSLLQFISKLSNSNGYPDPSSGWNSSSDPCKGKWRGIICDPDHNYVTKIFLDNHNFSGVFDGKILCDVESLSSSLLVVNVTNNRISGENLESIQNCSKLTYLVISGNQFSGDLPESFSKLRNLKILDISHNKFSGFLPDLSLEPRVTVLLAQDNEFSGPIPSYDFARFSEFNVSYNNLTGPIPNKAAKRFREDSFVQNPQLCGPPLPNNCTTSSNSESRPNDPGSEQVPPPHHKTGHKGISNDQLLMFSGYILIGIAILCLILLCLYKRGKNKAENPNSDNKIAAVDDSVTRPSFSTIELKGKEDFSTASGESMVAGSSLIVLTSPGVQGLMFEDLLKSPAELVGRGKHGTVFKVECDKIRGMVLAVKRMKDSILTSHGFKQRMRRLDQVKHPNVMPAFAFYSSSKEKIIVYEYQRNGSLFGLLHQAHGKRVDGGLDWCSRLSVAAKISEALAFMDEKLRDDRIPHGNLKSSNILFNEDMEPFISEYGLLFEDNQDQQSISITTSKNGLSASEDYNHLFKADTYAFGVILLEMLTGRTVLNEGQHLASWVVASLREEWTVEVFDKKLIRTGASEERLLNLLQVAIKCVNKSPEARPSMKQVASMIRTIGDADERSRAMIGDEEGDEGSMEVSELSVTRSFADVC